MPSPRATSTPATTGADSTLRDTTPWRFPKFKIRRRGDFPPPPAPSPSHEAHSPRRASMPAFPVSQEEHLCRWRSRHDVLLRTWARAWGLVLYSHHPHPPGHSLAPTLLSRLLLSSLLSSASQLSPRARYAHRGRARSHYVAHALRPRARYAHPGPPSAPSPPLHAHRFRLRTRYSHDKRGPVLLFTYHHEELLYLVSAYRLVLHY